jgi:uracil-DNA glycosylase family 4
VEFLMSEIESNDRAGVKAAIDALGEAASTCVACDLYKTRTKVVFGYGNPLSPMMIIGEGPGATEDATGLPFVGRAGKLLDECLRAAGLKREFVYIANVVKCRACIIEGKRVSNRPPAPQEIETCVPLWLEKQIDVIKPKVILCLGSPSANAIIHKNFKITQERGQWFESKYAPNVMAGLHPAFILRKSGSELDEAKATLVSDITNAKNRAKEAKLADKLT